MRFTPAQKLANGALLLCFLSPQSIAAQTKAVQATITIDAAKSVGQISPMLYGQFIEFMFEGVKRGLHAELLRDRSFEETQNAIGLPRYWERYPDDRNDDYGLSFAWDDSEHYPVKRGDASITEHALRVDAGDGVIPRHGVFQSRLPVRRNISYRGYFWLKAAGYHGVVTVVLESDLPGGPTYDEIHIDSIKNEWRRYDFLLRPRQSDPLARLVILFPGQGRLWMDQVSMLPNDAVDGVRRDVFARTRALKPAFIRWPGGNVAQDYHWLWGVGPRDERRTWTNHSWKNEPEPSDFGTDEFIHFCRAVGAEPSITVNVEGAGATQEEAAAWVEYCNGSANSTYGRRRALNGHREPYAVKYWEVGNEIWGDWISGHSSAETYARNFNRYAAAMRAVDSEIKLIAVGDNDMTWNRTVLSIAGQNIDYLAIHHYHGRKETGGERRNLMAHPLFYERFYKQIAGLLAQILPHHTVKLAINEWGLDLPVGQQYSMESALYGARLMNVFERTDGLVAMSAVSDMVNGWPGGIIQADRAGLFVSPLYWLNQMYSEHLGTDRLATEVQGPTFDASREGPNVPCLDVVASRRYEQIFVKAVNTDADRRLSTTINVRGGRVLPQASLITLGAPSLKTVNSFATPDAIKVKRVGLTAGASFVVTLPPHSVSVLTLYVVR